MKYPLWMYMALARDYRLGMARVDAMSPEVVALLLSRRQGAAGNP